MKRIIFKVPEALEFTALTADQQAAIARVLGQYSMPMAGTVATGGFKLVDAIADDTFNPANIVTLGLPFTIMGMWQWDLKPATTTSTIDPVTQAITTTTITQYTVTDPISNLVTTIPAQGALVELEPLDSAFISFLPDKVDYDELGQITTTTPAILHMPANWGGWPDVIL